MLIVAKMLIALQYCNWLSFPSAFSLSEFKEREQRQPVAGSYCQESGDWRKSGGK